MPTLAGEPVAAARWHARAAGWILPRSQAECARHWNAVYDLLEDAPATPENEELTLRACAEGPGRAVTVTRAAGHHLGVGRSYLWR